MKIQGEDAASAGHAGMLDIMNDIFAPGKEHTTEQKQYDERVGRRVTTDSGEPLDFGDNRINIVVRPSQNPAPVTDTSTAATDSAGRAERPHRKRKS